ncbi:MAG: hydroxymethylglutaryl-CoA synthase, partial [Lactobacillus sp.]|nr:hydroxymethylglutaryl-CoA synthase [Lactobacillus sp.]
LRPAAHAELLDQRRQLSITEYEAVFNDAVPYAKADYQSNSAYYAGPFVLTGVQGQERQYQVNPNA